MGKEKIENNRWWENYLVRYLAGNIFAVLILFFIFTNDNYVKQISKQLNYSTQGNNKILKNEIYNFIFTTTEEINSSNPKILKAEKVIDTNGTYHKIIKTEINSINLFILFVIGFLYMYISSIPIYLFHILRGGYNIFDFYKKTTFKRNKIEMDKNKEITSEYIKSYKHIREHGNAFGIILFEILFTFLLIKTNFSILFIMIWLLIGFSGWCIGIYLEMKMIDKKYNSVWKSCSPFYFLVLFIILLYIFK